MADLIRYLWRKVGSIEQRLYLLAELHDLKKWDHIPPSGSICAMLRNPSEAEDYINLLRFLRPSDRIFLIDVGANVGEWSQSFISYFPHTQVVAIEPSNEAHSALQKRYADDPRVVTIKAAASDKAGETTLYLGRESTLNSLEAYDGAFINDRRNILRGTEKVPMIRIDEAVTLGDADRRVLKLDVQGHEIEAIEGASGILGQIDIAICELSFVNEYVNRSASFAKVTTLMQRAELYPIIFQGYGKSLSNHRLESDVIYIKPALFHHLYLFDDR